MYVKKDIKYLNIPSGMFPRLEYAFAQPGIVGKDALTKDIANGFYKERDLELLKNLYFFRFMTLEQIYTILKIQESDMISFNARLTQLTAKRAINRFTLSSDEKSDLKEDALVVYCLDFLGVALLNHIFQKNAVVNYDVSMNVQDSNIIGKRLFIVDFYIKLLNVVDKKDIEVFDPSPEYPMPKVYEGGRATMIRFRPSFVFSIKKDGAIKSYVCEVFTDEEVIMSQELGKEMNYINDFAPKVKSFMPSAEEDKKAVPTLLVFVDENVSISLATSAVETNAPAIKTYRLASQESIANGLDKNGAFFKLEENTLKPVTMSVFVKNQ